MPYKDPEKRRECNRRYYIKNREKLLARKKKYNQEHREYYSEYRKKNREKISLQGKEYRRNLGWRQREAKVRRQKLARERLDDWFVRGFLKIKKGQYDEEAEKALVEAKRTQLKLHRLCRNQKT